MFGDADTIGSEFSEDKFEAGENLRRRPMIAASTQTSEMPETSRGPSRNATKDDLFDEVQNSSSEEMSDGYTRRGPDRRGLKHHPPLNVGDKYDDLQQFEEAGRKLHNVSYDDERAVGSTLPDSDQDFMITTVTLGGLDDTMEDALNIGFDKDELDRISIDNASVSSSLSFTDPLRRGSDSETELSVSTTLDHLYRANTNGMQQELDEEVASPRMRIGLGKGKNQTWAMFHRYASMVQMLEELEEDVDETLNKMEHKELMRQMTDAELHDLVFPSEAAGGDLDDSSDLEEHSTVFHKTWFPIEGTLQQKWYQVFDRSDTYAGQAVAVFIMFFIFASLVSMCVETLPANRFPNYGSDVNDVAPIFSVIDAICVSIFTLEYTIRFFSAGYVTWEDLNERRDPLRKRGAEHWQKRWSFFWRPLNMIDFLAILPFYLEFLTASSGVGASFTPLRLLRILRILRLFKLGRYVESLRIYAAVAAASWTPLLLLVLFLSFLWILGACFIYFCEMGEWREDYVVNEDVTGAYVRYHLPSASEQPTMFLSIIHSLWWAIATYALVGYGEFYPSTAWGYGVGLFYIILGVVAFSMPVSLMSQTYQTVVNKYNHGLHEDDKIDISMLIIKELIKAEKQFIMLEMSLETKIISQYKHQMRRGKLGRDYARTTSQLKLPGLGDFESDDDDDPNVHSPKKRKSQSKLLRKRSSSDMNPIASQIIFGGPRQIIFGGGPRHA